MRPRRACLCRARGGPCGLLQVGLRGFVASVAWRWLCSVGWLSVVVDDVGDRRCHEGCRWGCWKGCATGPLSGRMAGHSGLCRSLNRAVVGFVGWAWLPWLVSGVRRCACVSVLGVWAVPAVAGRVVDEWECGAVCCVCGNACCWYGPCGAPGCGCCCIWYGGCGIWIWGMPWGPTWIPACVTRLYPPRAVVVVPPVEGCVACHA